MSNSSSSSSGGISILGLLGVAFIVLKLCHASIRAQAALQTQEHPA